MTPQVTVTPRPAALSGVSAGLAALVLFAGLTLWHGGASAQTQEIGRPFQDCDVCPEMVVVPPGSFVMGSPESEHGHQTDEGPLRHVTIGRAFAIGKYEVTLDEFTAFIRDTGYSKAGRCAASGGGPWRNPGFRQSGRHPVTCIRWPDAGAYARWLSRKTGQVYRLPSESEWEYAARAGTETARYWGDRKGRGNAVCENCGSKWDHRRTAPVGSFAPNAYGLYDMLGNTWEWVEDCYASSYAGAPRDGGPRIEGDCRNRVMRGGSWESNAGRLRAANRNDHTIDEIDNDFGFRVVREVAPGDLQPQPPKPVARAPQPSPTPAQREIATLQIIGPNVTVNRSPASNGMAIKNGDYIATGPASRARLEFFSGGYLQLEENTDPGIWEDLLAIGKCVIEFVLHQGTGSGETGDCVASDTTPEGIEILIGSKYVLTAGPAATVLTILEGQATILEGQATARDERAVQVGAGEQVVISRGAITAPRRLNEVELRLLSDYLGSYDFTGQRLPHWPVKVPRIEGLGFEEAARIVSRAGLGLKRVGERSTERFPPGAIVGQRPEAGTAVPPGTAIYVEVAVSPTPVLPPKSLFQPGQGLGPNDRPGGRDVLTLDELKLCVRYDQAYLNQRDKADLAVNEVEQEKRKIDELDAALEKRIDRSDPAAVERYNSQLDMRNKSVRHLNGVLAPAAQREVDLQNQLANKFNSRCAGKFYYEDDMRVALKDLESVTPPPPVLVPNLRELTVPEAERRLAQANLRLGGVTERETDTAKPGTVFAQQPGPGTQAPPGAQVSVTVATAPTMTKVPQLFGSSLAQAEQRLSDADLRRGRVSEQLSESQAQGTIVGQSSKPGAMVARGSFVDVTRALAARRVPKLVGETLAGAKSRLSQTGLSIGKVATETTQKFKSETVMKQSPGPGTLVKLGTAVHVTIAKQAPALLIPLQPIQPLAPLQPTMCSAPKIDGLTYGDAKKLLAERNLQGEIRGNYGYNSNTVYRQYPKPFAQLPCDQPIRFDLGTIG